jgi:outer membrane protein assembly factor BamD
MALRAGLLLGTVCLAASAAAGCGSRSAPLPVAGSIDADKFLYDTGMDFLQRRKWVEAREYFRRLIDTYPRSQYRAGAKLGIGDTYLGEGRIDSLILGANEFREFLTLAPLSDRADYAQYRLAYALSRQMLGPQRDQTATREALVELERFREAYPDSKYKPEVEKLYRVARDRLSDHEFQVGRFNYNRRMYAGALARFTDLMKADPGYTRRDELIFYLAETYARILQPEEAKKLYEQLLKEHPKSRYARDAKERLGGGTPTPPVKR